MTKIEKERRWLVKMVPGYILDNYDEALQIEQFYTSDGWRYRRTDNMDGGVVECVKLKKVPVERGISQEIDITTITEDEYWDKFEERERYISKLRYVMFFNNLKIEVDDFDNIKLVIVEVEDIDFDDTVVLPPCIEEDILLEVTGNPKFSNYNLASIYERGGGEEF